MINEEWHIPAPEIPLRQGDLLIRRNPKDGHIDEICLVITADCDISQQKFGTNLAGLRVVSFQRYVKLVWAEKKLRNAIEKELKKIQEQLNKWNAKRVGGESALSADVVMDWVKRSDPDAICNALEIPAPELDKVKKNLGIFRNAMQAIDEAKEPDVLAQLVAFCSLTQASKSKLDHLKDFVKKAHEDELPDDVFLLTTLPQIDIGPAVVLFREIVSVPIKAIYFRASDAASEDVFLRVGKLDATIKYAISQAFGSLYSRIGLSTAYEKHRAAAMETSVNQDWEKP